MCPYVVRRQRLFEPDNVIISEHSRRLASPVQTVRPELFTAAGIDHQLDIGPDGFPSRADQQFIELAVASTERPPAELDRLEPSTDRCLERCPQRVGLVE